MNEVNIKFYHGLGDTSNFARMIPVYKKHGIDMKIMTTPDKQFPLLASGTTLIDSANDHHHWWIPGQQVDMTPGSDLGWSGNKSGENLKHYGLNEDGQNPTMNQLWKEFKEVDVQCKDIIPDGYFEKVDDIIKDWPKPLILWHSIGNTNRDRKSFNPTQQMEFLRGLIDHTDGTIILLDWDSRVSWTLNNRIKHMQHTFGNLDLPGLAALMYRSDLMIGIDSGPYYFSTLTDIPSVVVFFDGMHPCEYIIPYKHTLSFSTGGKAIRFDPAKRFEFQVINYSHQLGNIIKYVARMLKSNKYLNDKLPKASDVQLQQIVEELCRGTGGGGSISSIYDRNRSFDVLLSECKKRFLKSPIFVETGCIRSNEDWGGAGFSTALFGRYCHLTGGKLTSFDLDQGNVNYANKWCRQFDDTVNVVCCRGNDGLKLFEGYIDVLYLDSLDTGVDGHKECNLEEFQTAEEKISANGIVIIDDTPDMSTGKGALTVPYAISKGWKILYSGYQVVMSRRVL